MLRKELLKKSLTGIVTEGAIKGEESSSGIVTNGAIKGEESSIGIVTKGVIKGEESLTCIRDLLAAAATERSDVRSGKNPRGGSRDELAKDVKRGE